MEVDSTLENAWTKFKNVIAKNNINDFKELSLDSIYTDETLLSCSSFIKNCYKQVFDTTIVRKIIIPTEILKIDVDIKLEYFKSYALKNADYKGDFITLKQFQIEKERTPDGAWIKTFDFIKTKNGYKFFGCSSYGGPICCHE
jgi:hypothetical protein